METLALLESTCQQYDQRVTQLTKTENWPSELALAALTDRDLIQQLLEQRVEQPDPETIPPALWLALARSDMQLRALSVRFVQYPPLVDWRTSFNPPDHYWWWRPEAPAPPQDPLGWLWNSFTLAALTVNLALTQDIATRFLSSAPGVWSSLGAIAPVILTLFASGGALTEAGQHLLDAFLSNRGPSRKHWPKLKFFLSAALLAGLFSFHAEGLPRLARFYAQEGETLYEKGEWASAQANLQRALTLEPEFPEAQFRLGVLYEEYQEYDQAQQAYLQAVQGDYLPAYNNLARLYLRDGDYDRAAPLLRFALTDPSLAQQEPTLEYVLRKNLGQLRLEQNRLPEAETELLEAIRLGESLESKRPDAYCLLAQVLEKQERLQPQRPSPSQNAYSDYPIDLPSPQQTWTRCLRYANRPEYDVWENMARQALTQLGDPR
ncbi:MAG: tetratricopeptide repeat protein [Leptolyngbyaceae cyanobacterium MO_188.B28]|nr:tetratricopeptide repeat protein [Leptolyngbyaceae cyanobacterium MO_188.B28]